MSWKIGGKFLRRTDVKLILWYIITLVVSSGLLFTFLYFRMKHQFIKEIDRFLLDEIKELSEVLSRHPFPFEEIKNFEIKEVARTYYPIYFRVLDGNGYSLYTSSRFKEIEYSSDIGVLKAQRGEGSRENIHIPGRRRLFRIITIPFYGDGKTQYILQVGTHLHFVTKSLVHLRNNIFTFFPMVLILGTIGGWILAKRSLSPIGYIAGRVRNITSKNLGERLELRGTRDEMDELIQILNEMIARLDDSFKRLAEFTADASHELKTPICALKGEAEVLLSKARTLEEYQEGLARFMERFDYMNRMINDLILLSKADATQAELKMSPLRLDLLIQDLVSLFQILAEQKGLTLITGPLEEVWIEGDKVRLQQLFTNLIDNAIKYTPQGSIQIDLEKNKGTAVIRICDTGIGIPKEEHENIFKRFYRVDKSRSRETGGVGLGLSIAQWIAQAHHGRIEVKSELNKGSTFTVYLPIQKS